MFDKDTVTHCIILDKNNLDISNDVRNSLGVFYKRNIYIDCLPGNPKRSIISDNVMSCIKEADKQNFSFVILTWEGNMFSIFDFHREALTFIKDLDEKTEGNWLVAGHIMDQYKNRLLYSDIGAARGYENSFWLFPITAVLNLKKWREIGKPDWGKDEVNQIISKPIPSHICIHDNYTPIELFPSTETALVEKLKYGWRIIDSALSNNMSVYNLNDKIRESQNYLYPEVDPKRYDSFWRGVFSLPKFTKQYENVFHSVISSKYPDRTIKNTWGFFIRNTEEFIPTLKSNELTNIENFSVLVTPCSGFKDFILTSSSIGFKNPKKVIHYDILEECVKIKKDTIKNWDGTRTGFVKMFSSLEDHYVSKGKHNPFHMNSLKTYDEAYLELLGFFENEEHLKTCWENFKKLDHDYILIDMLDTNEIWRINQLILDEPTYLCLSDIALWRSNIIGYGFDNLTNSLENVVISLSKKTSNLVVDYKDPKSDLQYLHTAKDCLETFKNEFSPDVLF